MNIRVEVLRQSITIVMVIILVFSLGGCTKTISSSSHQQSEVENSKTVLVTITGDVKSPGKHQIRRTFSEESIREAGGGWWVQSLGGFAPVSFKLTRHSGGKNESWVVDFREMHTSKWRGFQFEEGDEIFVRTAIF